MKHIRKFLSKIFIAIICAVISVSAIAATNAPAGDIGDYGTFATEHNMEMFRDALVGENGDLVYFQNEFQNQLVRDYVPVEARVGLALMNALTHVAKILDTSLVRFMVIFIIVMYLFWVMFEAYNFMTAGTGDVKKLVMDLGKKAIWIIIWIAVLEIGPAQLFMYAMAPIVSIGTYLSDFILNAVAAVSGAVLPDTCDAIREYAAAHTAPDMLISANAAADIMCVPTRLSGFFTSAIAMGWKWMIGGVGHSAFSFVIGAVFVVVFAWDTWKFALMALGVIMDLFLGIIMLPFTALAETITPTSYKGLAGNIFNGFLKLFNAGPVKLDAQISRFINAAIYFVALSVVIAVCAGLLYGVIGTNGANQIPTLENDGFIPALLTGLLTAYLANRADEFAKNIGGGASVETSFGTKFGEDVKTLAKDTYETAKSWAKAIADDKKK